LPARAGLSWTFLIATTEKPAPSIILVMDPVWPAATASGLIIVKVLLVAISTELSCLELILTAAKLLKDSGFSAETFGWSMGNPSEFSGWTTRIRIPAYKS
jgi:hypothetical protein